MARVKFQYKKYHKSSLATAISFIGGILFTLITYGVIVMSLLGAMAYAVEDLSLLSIILGILIFVAGVVVAGMLGAIVQGVFNAVADMIGSK